MTVDLDRLAALAETPDAFADGALAGALARLPERAQQPEQPR